MTSKEHSLSLKSLLVKFFQCREVGVIIPLVVLVVAISLRNPAFLSVNNLIDILRTTSYSLVMAAPLTCLMITGDNDLTIGACASLGGICAAWGMISFGWGIGLSVLFALVVGAFCGLVKAVIVVDGKLPVFVAGLGLQYVINGFINITTSGNNITGVPDAFKVIGQNKFLGIHWTVYIALILAVAVHIMLKYTRFGREIYAVGGNRETARLAGINVRKIRFILHIATSVFAALCGVLMASRFSSAQVTAGAGKELTLMSAVIIGGTSFGGGSGGALGTLLGCLMLAVIDNGLVLMRVSSYWTNLVFGAILIISLFMDLIREKKSAGGAR